MQPVATVGDVRSSEVLASRQQVPDANRDQGAERDLERPAAHIHVATSCGAGMQVYAVGADAHAVVEVLRSLRPASTPTCCSSTVNSALMRRLSRTYTHLARPSVVPTTSGRRRRPRYPTPPSSLGASVCIQYSIERLSCRARRRCSCLSASPTPTRGPSQ